MPHHLHLQTNQPANQLTNRLTDSMGQSSPWESSSPSSSQIIHILHNLRVDFMFTRLCYLSVFWTRWIQPIDLPSCFCGICLNVIHLCLCLASCSFPSCSLARNLYAFPFSHKCTTCPAHLVLLDFITVLIFHKEYKSCCSSLCICSPAYCYFLSLTPKYHL